MIENWVNNNNPIPNELRPWYEQICDLLKIFPTKPLRQQIFPKPWFLIPSEYELQESTAESLILSVRKFLFSEGKTRSGVRRILANISPEASLIFLYIMRYVAFREAESHRYWPVLREIVFNNELSYDDVALGLASTTSGLWLRLYEETNGALYFPREGQRHIKWPLSHAGLLSDDKNVLEGFAYSLIATGAEALDTAISSETDEFILFLQDWLEENNEYSSTRLGNLIQSKRKEKVVIGELGQQWLRAQKEKIIEKFETQSSYQGMRLVPTRRNIVFDLSSDQLRLKLSIGRIKGNKTILFSWNQETISIPTQYHISVNETIPIESALILNNPNWDSKARLEINGEIQNISIPTIEKDQSLVFDGITGLQTKRWEFSKEYYVLIPGRLFTEKRASEIFKDWINLRQPRGEWNEYTLLWVRTKDPISDQQVGTNLVTLIEKFEQIVDEMNLPSFGHQFRVRGSLIGGELIDQDDMKVPTFHNTRPPYLEIGGIWNGEISAILSKRDELSGQFNRISFIRLNDEFSGSTSIIELWENKGDHGYFSISIEDVILDFQIIGDSDISVDLERIKTLDISSSFSDLSGNDQPNPSRHAVSELIINVKSWPFANLNLTVKHENQSIIKIIPVYMDQDGCWSQNIVDLPINFDELPIGNIIFEISWRGLFASEITAFEKNHLSPKNLDLKTQTLDGKYLTKIKGRILGNITNSSISIILLSEVPWSNKIQPHRLEISKNGYFEEYITSNFQPRWITFFQDGSHRLGALISINEIHYSIDNPNLEIEIKAFLKSKNDEWIILAKKISDVFHPPTLNKFLKITPVLEFLIELNDLLQSFNYWKFFSEWKDWGAISYYLKHNCSLALFKELPQIGEKPQKVIQRIKFNTKIDQISKRRIDLRIGEGEQVPITGFFSRHPIAKQANIRFKSLDSFCSCPTCQVLIPIRYTSNHSAPFEEIGDCDRVDNDCRIYDIGTELDSVVVGVFSDPLIHLFEIYSQLLKVMEGNRDYDDDFKHWLQSLRKLMPVNSNPQEWLRQLLDSTKFILNFYSSNSIQLNELIRDGNEILKNKSAIFHIIERIYETIPSR